MTLTQLFNQLLMKLTHARVYYGQGSEEAEDDVVLLLMAVLDVDFERLNRLGSQRLSQQQISQAHELLNIRINQRLPMAYIVGFAFFAGLKFKVDERVLIPRSPFAELIDKGFQPILDINHVTNALDLCTGSGCIGFALAYYYPHIHVDLSDLSADALKVAGKNRQQLQLCHRTQLIQSDLWQRIEPAYDLIVSNPPYVDGAEHADLPAEFNHEPAMALVSPLDGLLLPIKILASAAQYLSFDGHLFLEVGYNDSRLQLALPDVTFQWLEFEQGGQGICVFQRQDLIKYQPYFDAFLESHVT